MILIVKLTLFLPIFQQARVQDASARKVQSVYRGYLERKKQVHYKYTTTSLLELEQYEAFRLSTVYLF